MNLKALSKFHKTKVGHLVFGLVELLLAYTFASLAIGSGRFSEYGLAIIFLAGFLRNMLRIFLVRK
ncbi:MAG: hypothetical protein WC498_03265 [Candidatus Saccharimonadales bacterium]